MVMIFIIIFIAVEICYCCVVFFILCDSYQVSVAVANIIFITISIAKL